MITLRECQNELVTGVRAEMKRHKCILMQSATGSGKTVISAYLLQQVVNKGFDAFFLVHRKNLVKQTEGTLDQFNVKYSHITANNGYNPYAKVHICSIGTLVNRLEKVKVPKIIFVDETHLANSPSWSKVLDYYRAKGCWIIGLSATPIRLDGKGLNRHFSSMVCGKSMGWLIDHNYLSEYRYFAPSVPDMEGVGRSNGEWNKASMVKTIRKQRSKLVGDAVKHYKKHAMGMRAIAYCVSVEESKQTAIDFECAGITAQHIDGNTPLAEQRKIIRAFADGHIDVLVSVDLFTTGFDLAAQVGRPVAVQCVIMLRPTESLSLFLQIAGRALRYDGDVHIILDHAGNAAKHGLPCDEREWSLEGMEKKKSKKNDDETDVKSKDCPECFFVHKPAPVCPNCGYVHEIKGRKIGTEDGELEEIQRGQAVKEEKKKKDKARFFQLKNSAVKQGFKNPDLYARNTMIAEKKGLM